MHYEFLSTLSLRRATPAFWLLDSNAGISIHALLAESDDFKRLGLLGWLHFYPRSPCGERPPYKLMIHHAKKISIHALLAESDFGEINARGSKKVFLSTLSLRRATQDKVSFPPVQKISIHALLAESDLRYRIKAR